MSKKKKKGSKKSKEEKPVAEETESQEAAIENSVVEEPVLEESEPAAEETVVAETEATPSEEPAPEETVTEEILPEASGETTPEEVPSENAGAEEPAETVSLDDLLDEPPEEQTGEVPEGEAAPAEGESPEFVSSVPLKHIVEAILFASQKPVSAKELVNILKGAAEADKENPESPALPFAKIKADALRVAVEELRVECLEPTSTYEVRENAAGWQLVTKGDYSPWLRQLFPENRSARISAPAMETLAIIAYRQPITRADLEAVRGVAVDGVMQTLLDRSLIKIAGRAEIPGRPLLYETTQHFMEHFGLTNLDDLPNATELRKINLPKAPVPEEPAAPAKPVEAAPATVEVETVENPPTESLAAAPAVEESAAPEASEPAASDEQNVAEVPSEESAVALAEEEAVEETEIPVENTEPTEEAPGHPAPHNS